MKLSYFTILSSLVIVAAQASALPEARETTQPPKMCKGNSELVRKLNVPYVFLSDDIADDNGTGNTYMDRFQRALVSTVTGMRIERPHILQQNEYPRFEESGRGKNRTKIELDPPTARHPVYFDFGRMKNYNLGGVGSTVNSKQDRSVQMDFSKLPIAFREVKEGEMTSTNVLTNPDSGVSCWMLKANEDLLRERKVQTSTLSLAISDQSALQLDRYWSKDNVTDTEYLLTHDLDYFLVFENAENKDHQLKLVCGKSIKDYRGWLGTVDATDELALEMHKFTFESLPKEIQNSMSLQCDDIENVEEVMDRSGTTHSSNSLI